MEQRLITNLNYRLLKKIPHSVPTMLKIEVMYWNIWRQFGISQENAKNLKAHDCAWTPQVRKEFYNIFPHRHLLRCIEKKGELDAWLNMCEPELFNNL